MASSKVTTNHNENENGLAFLHQDKTAQGEESRFNKLVSRDS